MCGVLALVSLRLSRVCARDMSKNTATIKGLDVQQLLWLITVLMIKQSVIGDE